MKTIKLPTTTIFDAKDQLRSIVGSAPKDDGYSIGEVRSAIRVLEKLDDLDDEAGVIQLEDAEFAFVIGRVSKVKWGGAHADIVNFMDAISNPT